MFKKILTFFIFCGCFLVLSGCVYNDEPRPEIIYTPKTQDILPLVKPPVFKPTVTYRDVPREWVPPLQLERNWSAIVVHHSATDNGNAAIFDKWHRENHNWDGIGYDFVIGNGTDSSNGQVEVTPRWRQQRTGAHCKTPNNWANENAIGICLVGNFNNTVPTSRQMQSLLKLVRFLQVRYGIPKSRIYGHNTTPGARVTDCPGKKFPMARLKSMLNF